MTTAASIHRVAFVLAALTLSGVPSGTQQPERDSTALPIRIDVVVTDRHGRPVVDLRPAEFELLENGVPRRVADVRPRTKGPRLFALYLDEFHVSPGESADRVRAWATQLIDGMLEPDDTAVVMKPLDSIGTVRFTADRASLRQAVAGFTGRKGDFSARSAFEEKYIGRAPAAVAAARRQIVTAALRELAMRLGEMEADRGVVVLFSEGFAGDTTPARGGAANLNAVARAAARYHLAFYTFNPAPEQSPADAEQGRAGAMLSWLATQTGGRASGAVDFDAGLGLLAQDTSAYYALTYEPPRADGRFHAVEIRTSRRHLQVHARSGYWATVETDWRWLTSLRQTTPARELRRSQFADAWVGLLRDPVRGARMIVSWESRVKGAASPQLAAVKARTVTGQTLYEGQIGSVGSGSAADSARFDVPVGRVQLDMTMIDSRGKVLDTDVRDIDVPDLLRSQRVGPVLLPAQIVRTRTVRDFQSASANPNAAPSSIRSFMRADRLLIRVPAFDPAGIPVRVAATLLNRSGHPMRDVEVSGSVPLDGVTQFALPLSFLAPGEYQIELSGANANGTTKERFAFRVSS